MNPTNIEYLDFTYNPIVGCDMSLPCAERCWARRMAHRLKAQGKPQYRDVVAAKGDWNGKTAFGGHALKELLRRRKPATVGLCFMGDAFHESVPDGWLDRTLAVVALTPHLRYVLLTKRAKRMREYMTSNGQEVVCRVRIAMEQPWWITLPTGRTFPRMPEGWPLPNLSLGISASNQAELDARAGDLVATPAACRLLSLEPLIGAVDLGLGRWIRLPQAVYSELPWNRVCAHPGIYRADANPHGALSVRLSDGSLLGVKPGEFERLPNLDWIVVGGESGPGARPMHPDWARSVRDQCQAGVPFYFKQWGGFRPVGSVDSDDCIEDAVETANIRRTVLVYPDGRIEHGDQLPTDPGGWFMEPFGKRTAGRLLDGREWLDLPEMLRRPT